MKYKSIDPSLKEWAANHGLHIFTQYKDYEVRSTDIVGNSGEKFQIWIEPSKNSFLVNVWDYKKRKSQFSASSSDIGKTLEEAYETAVSWMA